MPAGYNTEHVGYGKCSVHSSGSAEAAWRLAMDLARALDTTPWDALLMAVRLSAGAVVDAEQKLREAEQKHDGVDGIPTEVRYWRQESRRERTLMARTARAAIDAGVAERIVRQVELEGQVVAAAVAAALDALDLTTDQRMDALSAAQTRLFAIEATSSDPSDGSVDGSADAL